MRPTEETTASVRIDKNDPAFLFLNLHPDEEIKKIIRRHWAGFIGTIGIFFAMGVVPLVILFGLSQLGFDFSQYKIFAAIGVSGYLIFILTFLFGSWVNFYYDIIIVTDERLINISQEGLLARKISELRLRQIQNVTSEQTGIFQTFLNYGLLVVETAGEGTTENPRKADLQGYFTVADIPDSNRIARMILELSRLQHAKMAEARL